MGIQGLHKALAFVQTKSNIQDFRGKTVAVDTSSWLHKSVYSVAPKYVEALEAGTVHNDPTCVKAASKYIIARCRELLMKGTFGIGKIYLVMDGKRCPLKSVTNAERERKRQQNLAEARAYKAQNLRREADDKYRACIKIKEAFTQAVLREVARAFPQYRGQQQEQQVELVWSPYEADAQLAKLCIDLDADAVVTEDSDILLYSASSHVAFPVIYKLDRGTGSCDIISMDWLLSPKNHPKLAPRKGESALEKILKSIAMRQQNRPGFGVRLFIQACMLTGSDYSPNLLDGIGLVNAFKMVREAAFREHGTRFKNVLNQLPRKAKGDLDLVDYEMILAKSEAVFYYHIVRHANRDEAPLCTLLQSMEVDLAKQPINERKISDHQPAMDRFDDPSFLGESRKASDEVVLPVPAPVQHGPPLREVTIANNSDPPINPYKKQTSGGWLQIRRGTAYQQTQSRTGVVSPKKKTSVKRRPDSVPPHEGTMETKPSKKRPLDAFLQRPATSNEGGSGRRQDVNRQRDGVNESLPYQRHTGDVRFVKPKQQRYSAVPSLSKFNDRPSARRVPQYSVPLAKENIRVPSIHSNTITSMKGDDDGQDPFVPTKPPPSHYFDLVEENTAEESYRDDDGFVDLGEEEPTNTIRDQINSYSGYVSSPAAPQQGKGVEYAHPHYEFDHAYSKTSRPVTGVAHGGPMVTGLSSGNHRQAATSKYFQPTRPARVSLEPSDVQTRGYQESNEPPVGAIPWAASKSTTKNALSREPRTRKRPHREQGRRPFPKQREILSDVGWKRKVPQFKKQPKQKKIHSFFSRNHRR